MKTYTYALLAAAAATGMALGQTAYTTPVGYTTTTLKQGFNNVGITVHAPTKIAGNLEVIATNSVQDTTAGVNFTTALGATGTLHILEITSGAALGFVSEINTWNTSSITTVDNLVAQGVVAGDTYKIRKAPTLEEIFGTATTGPLTAGGATTADLVHVPTGVPGQYTQYHLTAGGAFRSVVPSALAPNVPVVYLDGLFVQRKATGTKDLVISGEVKTTKTKSNLVTGFNYIGTVYPVGSTIQNSGLEAFITPGAAAVADIIHVPTATPGQYTQVFRNAANTWRTVVPAGNAPVIDLTGAIFIERKGAATPYAISVPSTWSVTP
ncbi:MAG: hypothetical protein EOP84_07785 [Verrucomicrobiaceae bacterium]|nr:MAG: hypothetical protein EOP84_07785 [Verrucomicrobiaceae bacterium]